MDIIFVEILKIISWFNPFIYFYQKAMITNHEFLADKGVINTNKNIKDYQELILSEVLKQQNLALIQTFNFNNTKKRFIMMTKKNSKFAKTKMLLTIPVLAIAGFMFAEKTIKTIDLNEVKSQQENDGVSQLISDALIVEYNQIIKKYSTFLDNHEYAKFEKIVTVADKEKLSQLYKKLTDKQKDETALVFFEQKGKNVMGFKGQKITLALRDTISPPKNKEAKLTDPKSVSDISEKKITQDISTAVEGKAANMIPAEYPGGVDKLRSIVSSSFNSAILPGNEGLVKSMITFIVDKNGKVKDLKVSGESEKVNDELFSRSLKRT